jgi:hypothetical protein
LIVVHELAHLKEREHGRAFYALCTHMEADYHPLELDLRLWLTAWNWSRRRPERRLETGRCCAQRGLANPASTQAAALLLLSL